MDKTKERVVASLVQGIEVTKDGDPLSLIYKQYLNFIFLLLDPFLSSYFFVINGNKRK